MKVPSSDPKQTKAWKSRRLQADKMFDAGDRQSKIARTLQVSRQCVHNWYQEWQRGGHRRKRRPGEVRSGRKSKLEPQQLSVIQAALRRGPRAFGFVGQRWTLWRVATVIEGLTGVRYHPSSIWRILRSLGWKLRVPPKADSSSKSYIPRVWTAPKPRSAAKAR